MYQNYIFDLYGTLVDIHTNEKKAYLWKKMSLFFGMKGAAYEPKELRMAYETKIKEQEAALKMECRGSHVPEIDIADVFRQLFEDQAVSVTEEIADLAKMFRAISIEELSLFPGVPEMLQRLKDAGKKVFLLSNAQALFTAPEISLLGLTKYFDGILLSSDAGVKKPDPAFYEMLLKQYHLDPAECLMTGNDDIADCHGAASAGDYGVILIREHAIILLKNNAKKWRYPIWRILPFLPMSGKRSFNFSAFLYSTGISDNRHKSEHCIPAIPPDNQVQSE